MDFCPNHSEVVAAQGEIKGKLDMLILGVEEVKNTLTGITRNGAKDRIDIAVERAKTKPLFWAVMIIGAVIITRLIELGLSKFFK
jgi:hypothetical protein